jgi:hypothetical protein
VEKRSLRESVRTERGIVEIGAESWEGGEE